MHNAVSAERCSFHDLAAVRDIFDDYYTSIGVLLRDGESQLEKYFRDASGVWLARDGGEPVGCIALRPLDAIPLACEIKRLYVRESHRGMHVADILLDQLEGYAAAQNYRFAYLDSRDDLHAAMRFYKRRGYEACERYNDNPQATVFMRRCLLV